MRSPPRPGVTNSYDPASSRINVTWAPNPEPDVTYLVEEKVGDGKWTDRGARPRQRHPLRAGDRAARHVPVPGRRHAAGSHPERQRRHQEVRLRRRPGGRHRPDHAAHHGRRQRRRRGARRWRPGGLHPGRHADDHRTRGPGPATGPGQAAAARRPAGSARPASAGRPPGPTAEPARPRVKEPDGGFSSVAALRPAPGGLRRSRGGRGRGGPADPGRRRGAEAPRHPSAHDLHGHQPDPVRLRHAAHGSGPEEQARRGRAPTRPTRTTSTTGWAASSASLVSAGLKRGPGHPKGCSPGPLPFCPFRRTMATGVASRGADTGCLP